MLSKKILKPRLEKYPSFNHNWEKFHKFTSEGGLRRENLLPSEIWEILNRLVEDLGAVEKLTTWVERQSKFRKVGLKIEYLSKGFLLTKMHSNMKISEWREKISGR